VELLVDETRYHDPGSSAVSLEDLFGAVDRPPLRRHLVEFARRVKLSGTPAELESFRYLEERMREYGFRTSLLLHDAYISLPGACSVEVDARALRSITHSMSKPTGAAGIRAELVYIGLGDAAAFKNREVAGRIALVDGIATEEVAHSASRAGAVGQLHISPTEHLYEMCISPVWGNPSQHTRSELPTTAAATISRDDGAVLRERCRRGEKVVASMRTEVDTGWRKTPLLVAELDPPGASEDAPFVLLSGHHDTWHYGVMDNGAANATMLEAARLLARRRRMPTIV